METPNQTDDLSADAQDELADAFLKRFCAKPFEVKPGVYVRCQSRSTAVCQSCAGIYSGDWRAIIRSGVFDADTSGFRFFMLTLTAPSFGAVHSSGKVGQEERRCRCGARHDDDERLLAGTPISPDTYDYTAAAAWNRDLGALIDVTRNRIRRRHPDFEYCIVREWQSRLSLHVHALIRVPTTDGPSASEITEIAKTTWASSRVDGTVVRWGDQARCDEFPTTEDGAATISYLAKAINYLAKDVLLRPASDARLHYDRFHRAARMEMNCAKCVNRDPYMCRAKIHDNLGARQHVVSASRRTADRPGWSMTGLTRGGQREGRRAWASDAVAAEGDQARRSYRQAAGVWAASHKRAAAQSIF